VQLPRVALALWACIASACAPTSEVGPAGVPAELVPRLRALVLDEDAAPRPDVTNAYADDPAAARLGQRLFFDTRFSGPLLDGDDNGNVGTLGVRGEAGRVSCAGCHIPTDHFVDTRSSRGVLSLAASWTRRRTPTLLDFGQSTLLMWDGRFDTGYEQLFGVVENPVEFNSSRLFVAQQMLRFYRADYEAIFGPAPSIDGYAAVDPTLAGCTELPADPVHDRCVREGHEDPAVIRILVNMGKAITAYERLLRCGPSRFDAWMNGDESALNDDERAGALVFVEHGCDHCHSGPTFSDGAFHNVGVPNLRPDFIEPYDDPGAAVGLATMLADPIGSGGAYSDGQDDRHAVLPADLETLRGAFRTPGLRCIGGRPSYLHAGQLRSLADVIGFFDRGGGENGFQGVKDPRMVPLGLSADERRQLLAFLLALEGPGPRPELLAAPRME